MAGTTLNRQYPFPTGTDQNDVPFRMQALAEAIDQDVQGIAYVSTTAAPPHRPGRRWFNPSTGRTLVSDGALWTAGGIEVIENILRASRDGLQGQDLAVGDCSITIPAGTWELTAGASMANLTSNDTMSVAIHNATAVAIVPESTGPGTVGGPALVASGFSLPRVITVTQNTVLRPYIRRDSNTVPGIRAGAGGASAWIRAVRR